VLIHGLQQQPPDSCELLCLQNIVNLADFEDIRFLADEAGFGMKIFEFFASLKFHPHFTCIDTLPQTPPQ
jgi:hypothetical protein